MREQIFHLWAVGCRFVKSESGCLGITEGQVEAITEFDEVCIIEFFMAMRGHFSLTGTTHSIAFFGLRENDGWLTRVIGRSSIGGVDFHQIMTTALELINLLVGHSLSETCEFFILTKKIVTVKAPVFRREGLHLTVNSIGKGARQRTGHVTCEEPIPVAAPD